MAYLSESDDDNETKEEMTLDEEFPEEEMDEETRNIIFGAKLASTNDNDLDNELKELSVKKKKKESKSNDNQSKTLLSLKEFLKESKSKKWVSTRIKTKNPIDIEKVKIRQFNPRLPPYKSINHNNNNNEDPDINNEFNFPKLK